MSLLYRLLLASSLVLRPFAMLAQESDGATTLAPGVIARNVFRGTFAKDGRRLLYFRRTSLVAEQYEIVESRLSSGGWSAPRRVELGGSHSDLYPSISADGTHLVFASYRPGGASGGGTQLWIADRAGEGWSSPRRLAGSPANAYNAGPEFAPDGSIWFTSTPNDGSPRRFMRAFLDGRVEENALLAPWRTWRPDRFVWSGTPTPDGRAIVLTVSTIDSVSRRTLPSDLYVTQRSGGRWTIPRPLGHVNTPGTDNFSFFSGDELYFVRDFDRIEHLPFAVALRDSLPAVRADALMPFDYEDTRLYVPVQAGRDVAWLILDSGAQPTILDERLAAALRVTGSDTTFTTGAGAGRLRRSTGGALTLRVGGSALALEHTAIAPLDSLLSPYTGRHAPGIVGSRFFAGRAVTVDFESRIAYARRTADRYELADATVLPMSLEGDIPFVTATLRFADGRAIAAKLLVDLGAKANLLLTEPFIERAGLRAVRDAGVRSSLGAGIGGETRYSFVRLASLELGPSRAVRVDSAVIGLSIGGTLRATYYDGLLGAELLRRFRVTFDAPRRRLILRPREPAAPNLDFDMSGLFLTARGDDLRTIVVADVAPGSPASAAGVSAGDRITSVDGRPVQRMTLSAVRTQLRGPAGKRVTLELVRGERPVSVTVVLVRRV
jgi:hypothetical protein